MTDPRTALREAIAAMREAILGGVEIPSEFAPFVNQYLPGLAKQAQFAEREGLIARMMGAAPEEPRISTDSDAPERRIDPLLTRFPQGNVGTRTPNAYRAARWTSKSRIFRRRRTAGGRDMVNLHGCVCRAQFNSAVAQ